MYQIRIDHLNLEQIAQSGQCFRWKKLGNDHFSVVAFDRYLEMKQEGDLFSFSCSEEEWQSIWRTYFDFDTDYQAIEELIQNSGDKHLKAAYEFGSGIRVLRQELWEVIVSFIISQNNHIRRITNSIDRLCNAAGCVCEGGRGEYRFPMPGEVSEGVLMNPDMGFGYRSDYLRDIYAYAKENPTWLERLKNCDYSQAMELLLERRGIGKKVANCICLFGLHQIDAFPIDTHIRRILDTHYPNGFDFERYKTVAGIIQQYLFYYKLVGKA